ncbi:glycosyltransferase family 2 protein [Inquilinus sp. NPDC058860]|uniref:glycosyltransferase family 2 protein n=1 Tax=Inquilinus sp. NPDC058860 TaxID=3346652 RepID=UPI00369A4A1E
MPDISVVVISTNEGVELDPCLASVLASTADFELVVFNNASTDQTGDLLAHKYRDSRMSVVTNPTKLGFIENNNKGIELARGRYVLLLNADTILKPDTLAAMVNFMDAHADAAVATCRLLYPDGAPQAHVRRFPTPGSYFWRITHLDRLFPRLRSVERYLMNDLRHDRAVEVDWFITAFFFMRKEVIDRIGALDRTLLQPFYCEDLEWCYRARLAGYKNYYLPDVAITHVYRQSSSKRFSRLSVVHLCNIAIFFWKHRMALMTGKVAST